MPAAAYVDAAATEPPEPESLRYIDWPNAVQNHGGADNLRAFLVKYPDDLRRYAETTQKVLSGAAAGDTEVRSEELRDAAQQVMGSSHYVAAMQLNERAVELVDAIDSDDAWEKIVELATRTVSEAEELEKEIRSLRLGPEAEPTTNSAKAVGLANQSGKEDNQMCKGCCVLM